MHDVTTMTWVTGLLPPDPYTHGMDAAARETSTVGPESERGERTRSMRYISLMRVSAGQLTACSGAVGLHCEQACLLRLTSQLHSA